MVEDESNCERRDVTRSLVDFTLVERLEVISCSDQRLHICMLLQYRNTLIASDSLIVNIMRLRLQNVQRIYRRLTATLFEMAIRRTDFV